MSLKQSHTMVFVKPIQLNKTCYRHIILILKYNSRLEIIKLEKDYHEIMYYYYQQVYYLYQFEPRSRKTGLNACAESDMPTEAFMVHPKNMVIQD